MAIRSSSWTNEEKERAWKLVRMRFLQVFTLLIWKTKGLDAMEKAGGSLKKGELQLLDNAALESTLMSLRDVDDFFDAKAPRPDDLRATDFGAFQNMGSYLQPAERTILNKALAHLTNFRISPHQRTASAPSMDELNGLDITTRAVAKIEKFLDFLSIAWAASHPNLVESFRDTKSFATRKLETLRRESKGQFVVKAGILNV